MEEKCAIFKHNWSSCIGVMIVMGYTSRKKQENTVRAFCDLKCALLIFDHILPHTLNQTISMVYIALEYHKGAYKMISAQQRANNDFFRAK